MTYLETLEYLYSTLPVFHKSGPSAIKKGLGNIQALCAFLGNPEKKVKTIHIAGTNGKGSSSHMVAAILQAAGYKTGLYTSPHLKNFTERIKINGKEIPEDEVVRLVQKIDPAIKKIEPSFFEVTVAMAFDYFLDEQVDVAVIEVGLGGRLDSTNIITPDACLITNISFDHQSILGYTLPEIAYEKAGIIKPEVPVVVSEKQPDTADVFTKTALENKAELTFASEQYFVNSYKYENGHLLLDIEGKECYSRLVSGLGGLYQLKNIKGVLALCKVLVNQGYKIEESHIREGIAKVVELTGLKGRWQIIGKSPLIICDTGHNPGGVTEVVQQLKSIPHERLFMVIGMVNDKDVTAVLKLLPKTAFYYFCQANLPRALNADVLAEKAASVSLQGVVVRDVNQAIIKAKEAAKSDDVIFVGGSTFVVAEVAEL